MDLFEQQYRKEMEKDQPLAARMRPGCLEEYIGQEHIVGRGRLLYRAIKADQLSSLIFFGPPGTGKTSLAFVIAGSTKSHFVTINAVLSGVKEIRREIDAARERKKFQDTRTILFVDEVHRWNKAQQDALLPWVESGAIILIGATIENPYFEVNRALVSRSRIFQLEPLKGVDLHAIAHQALADQERGYGRLRIRIDDNALEHLIDVSGGDARSLLNALELAVETTPSKFPPPPSEDIHITMEVAEESIQRRAVLYDKEGDYHFDTISAFIKSMRGSDPDAVLYWLAKMIYAGEDPRFIFRRMLIFASEDIGLADPNALLVTEAAASAFDRVGLPEGRFHLANAALYLATAVKSNSIFSFFDALKTVEHEQEGEVPQHLKDDSRDANAFGHGKGYLYPHAFRDHWVAQQYLPDTLQGRLFYHPGELGYEASLKDLIEKRREDQLSAMLEMQAKSHDILTFSPKNAEREKWLARATGSVTNFLSAVRDRFFKDLDIGRHWLVFDANAKSGLLTWELVRKTPEGGVWALTDGNNKLLNDIIYNLPELDRPHLLRGDLADIDDILKVEREDKFLFDLIVARNCLVRRPDKEPVLDKLVSLLREGGKIALVEEVPRWGQRFTDLLERDALDHELYDKYLEVERMIYNDSTNYLVNWDDETLRDMLQRSGFQDIRIEQENYMLERIISDSDFKGWFEKGKGETASYVDLLRPSLSEEEINIIYMALRNRFGGGSVKWRKSMLYVQAQAK